MPLFDKIIFGPVLSRRLGISLGVNLMPTDQKICTFDCIYCECGWTQDAGITKGQFHSLSDVVIALEKKLNLFYSENKEINSITFAGNGEPTLHPQFSDIIDNVILLRDQYFPKAEISVLSNSTTLPNSDVVNALKKVDKPIMKLDAGSQELYELINKPLTNKKLSDIVSELSLSGLDKMIIQTMFLKGTYNNIYIDNTSDVAVEEWLDNIVAINPLSVMIYSLDRETPAHHLEKVPLSVLGDIVKKLKNKGFNAKAY